MGADSCLLCFQFINLKHILPDENYGDNNYKEKLFHCCRSRLLGVEIKSSFNWHSVLPHDSYFPFCSNCFQFSKQLWEMEDKLNQIKRDLDKIIEAFSNDILQNRLNVLSHKVSSSEKEMVDNDNTLDNISIFSSSQPDDDNLIISLPNNNTDSSSSSLSPTNSMEIKIETFKEEKEAYDSVVNDGDTYFADENETVDFLDYNSDSNSHTLSENQMVEEEKQFNYIGTIEDNVTPLSNKLSEIYSKFRFPRLSVSIEKLQFDSKGKIKLPMHTSKRSGKRKAAIAAKASLTKNIRQEEYLLKTETLLTKRHKEEKDDDFIVGDLDSDVECTNVGDNKKRRKRSVKRRLKVKETIELKCGVCSSGFDSPVELDNHSKESGHVTEKTVECQKCHEKFYRNRDKQWHTRECNFVSRSCGVCGENFTSFKPYRYHLRTHRKPPSTIRKPKVSHKCVKCNKCFFTRYNLSEHKKTHKEENKRIRKSTSSKRHLIKIRKQEDLMANKNLNITGDGENLNPDIEPNENDEEKSLKMKINANSYEELKCVSCSALFRLTSELDAHSEETGHVNKKSFECFKCLKTFYRDTHLYSHARHCNFVSKDCNVCGKNFTSYNKYRCHFKQHSQPRKKRERKTYKCDECEKIFSNGHNLSEHMNSHSGKKPYECSIDGCKAKFAYHSELSVHRGDHYYHKLKVQCKICGLFYRNDTRLSMHIRQEHSRENLLPCGSCDMIFKKMMHFVAHQISSHGMESPYKCKHCQSTFGYKKDLTDHLYSVHGEKPPSGDQLHSCNVCDKTFKNPTTLYYHTLSHTNISNEVINKHRFESEKGSFQCEECGKTYPYLFNLKTHLKQVHAERRFPCKVCGKVFKTKNVLRIHEMIHTDEQFVCEVCGRGFTKKCNLQTHIKRIHEQNKKPRKPFTKTPFAKPK